MKYRFLMILTKENDGITVIFPTLKGCISCGYTFEEAIKNGKEALELHIKGLLEDNSVLSDYEENQTIKLCENQKAKFIEIEI